MSYVEVNGTSLYYEDVGGVRFPGGVSDAGGTAPLVFVHGMCGNANGWDGQVRRLSSQFRCVAYDRRGHTRSPFIAAGASGDAPARSVQLHADDAAALIEALGLAPCVLVGSSSGARIAVDVIRRHSHLLAGAVLSEPPLFALDQEGGKTMIAELKPRVERAIETGGQSAAVDAFFNYMCPGLWRAIDEPNRQTYRANHVELLGDLQMPPYQITPEDLSRIEVPCLVIAGSESHPLFRTVTKRLVEAIPNARLRELAGSGHATYFEKPDEFADAVKAFSQSATGPEAVSSRGRR